MLFQLLEIAGIDKEVDFQKFLFDLLTQDHCLLVHLKIRGSSVVKGPVQHRLLSYAKIGYNF